MRTIEHRRHTMRVMPGQDLSQAGVDLARATGDGRGPFDLVVTSTIPRAFQTAIAMGFAVNELREELSLLPEDVEREIGSWDVGYAAFASGSGAVAAYASALGALHRDLLERVPDGGRVLVISHGAVVEASAAGCLGERAAVFGSYADYCEGFSAIYEDGAFTGGEVLRITRRP